MSLWGNRKISTVLRELCVVSLVLILPSVGALATDFANEEAPPLGYVGPAPAASTSTGKRLALPLGFVGEVPRTLSTALPSANISPIEGHKGETLISAEKMHSDSATGIVTATGKVEIVRGDYELHADKVTYNPNTSLMTADGHVVMLSPSGDVSFADHEEVTGDLKQAFGKNIGILFPDNSRMAARDSQRYDGRYTLAEKAAYTACNVCIQNPDQPPLWQLRAGSITHDNVEHALYYHDVTVDLDGVPIAYTPYLSGPDPTVKRKSGLLSPQPGYSPNIGAFIKMPYYVDIAPDKDATIIPTFSSNDKLQLGSQYRERWDRGNLKVDGSITQANLRDESGLDKGDKWRGDLFGNFRYDLDSTWRTGTDVQYVSDKSYLHRYGISSNDQNISRAYLEGFENRDYVAVNSYHFQDLRPGIAVAEPIVLPSATLSMLGSPGQTLGGRWSFDANSLITSRDLQSSNTPQHGFDTRRLSMNGGWQRQLVSDTGLVTTVSGLARTDSYWANKVPDFNGTTGVHDDSVYTRPFAQGNAVMRYPMARSGDGYQHLMEPIVAMTVAPDTRVISKQPVEDSLDIEFDETNLFSPNRFTGSDLIEGGSRVTYGMRNALTATNGARIDVFGGQSYDFSGNNQFTALSGLAHHRSDYVGRIDFAPSSWLSADYGFRLDENNFSPQRQDALLAIGKPIFRPTLRYIEAYESYTPTGTSTAGYIGQVRQATVGITSHFEKYWGLNLTHTQGFDPQPGPRNSSIALTYIDECFAVGVTLSRDDTNRVDISSGTSATFHIYMKNLGGLGTDSASNIQFPAEFRQTE